MFSLGLHDPRRQHQWIETIGRQMSSLNRMQNVLIEPTKGGEMVRSTGWVTTGQCDLGEGDVAVGL